MLPTIRSRDTLLVEPVEPATVRRGDILLYASGLRLFAHRVVAIIRPRAEPGCAGCTPARELRFLLRGDNCPRPDPPVEGGQVLGRVTAVERSGRRMDPSGPGAFVRISLHRLRRCLQGALAAFFHRKHRL
jgi:hypothetical protein